VRGLAGRVVDDAGRRSTARARAVLEAGVAEELRRAVELLTVTVTRGRGADVAGGVVGLRDSECELFANVVVSQLQE
jgi:hypothetical protein